MFGVRVHEQLLESLRQKSLLPRVRNDRVIRLLGRLFRLVFRRFCSCCALHEHVFRRNPRMVHDGSITNWGRVNRHGAYACAAAKLRDSVGLHMLPGFALHEPEERAMGQGRQSPPALYETFRPCVRLTRLIRYPSPLPPPPYTVPSRFVAESTTLHEAQSIAIPPSAGTQRDCASAKRQHNSIRSAPNTIAAT